MQPNSLIIDDIAFDMTEGIRVLSGGIGQVWGLTRFRCPPRMR